MSEHDFQFVVQLSFDTQNNAWGELTDNQIKFMKWYEGLLSAASSNRPGTQEVTVDYLENLLTQVLRRMLPYNFEDSSCLSQFGSGDYPGGVLKEVEYVVVSLSTCMFTCGVQI